ncbi:hypothetical protein PSEUDO8O_20332 [Pseudomonas sp. 8O]|nr:hypothetical protein PSEUDO8O_20332 [Pseudomonas sp. 8O]
MVNADAIAQRLAQRIETDLEGIARLRLDAVGERQRRGAEEVHMHIAGTQELAILEVVVLEVLQAVAHVVLTGEELLLPQHLVAPTNTADAGQVTRQLADQHFRAEGTEAQLRVGQVQVVLALDHMVGELVAKGEADAIRLAIVANHIEAGQLGLLTEVLGEVGHREVLARANHDAAITFVEPLRLRAFAACGRATAGHAPLEHLHGVGELAFGLLRLDLLVHLVAGGGAAQVGQAGAGHQAVRRIGVIQRRQYTALLDQFGIDRARLDAQALDLGDQAMAVTDRLQRQLTGRGHTLYYADARLTDDADLTLALLVLKLNQPHCSTPAVFSVVLVRRVCDVAGGHFKNCPQCCLMKASD